MSDPYIAAKVHAHRHLARRHLEHLVAKTRSDLGLVTIAGIPVVSRRDVPPAGFQLRDARGRFLPKAATR